VSFDAVTLSAENQYRTSHSKQPLEYNDSEAPLAPPLFLHLGWIDDVVVVVGLDEFVSAGKFVGRLVRGEERECYLGEVVGDDQGVGRNLCGLEWNDFQERHYDDDRVRDSDITDEEGVPECSTRNHSCVSTGRIVTFRRLSKD
jgi:hypothetical protein